MERAIDLIGSSSKPPDPYKNPWYYLDLARGGDGRGSLHGSLHPVQALIEDSWDEFEFFCHGDLDDDERRMFAMFMLLAAYDDRDREDPPGYFHPADYWADLSTQSEGDHRLLTMTKGLR